MKLVIVGNPVAGRGSAAGQIETLDARLRRRGHQVEKMLTRKAGDARRFAGEVPHDTDRLVIVGGDGTINEVLNGLQDPSRTPLVPFAMGTGNLLARELRLPRKLAGIESLVESEAVCRVDMGLIGERRFIMVASAGFDSMVARDVALTRTRSLGFRGYVAPVLRTLRRYTPPALRVRVDGGETIEGALVVVGNIRVYAAILSMTDRAVCDDGVLDVVVLPRGEMLRLARYAMAAWRRRLSSVPGVIYRTGHAVTIEADEPVPVEVDGDHHGVTPASITMQPGVVPVVVGEG